MALGNGGMYERLCSPCDDSVVSERQQIHVGAFLQKKPHRLCLPMMYCIGEGGGPGTSRKAERGVPTLSRAKARGKTAVSVLSHVRIDRLTFYTTQNLEPCADVNTKPCSSALAEQQMKDASVTDVFTHTACESCILFYFLEQRRGCTTNICMPMMLTTPFGRSAHGVQPPAFRQAYHYPQSSRIPTESSQLKWSPKVKSSTRSAGIRSRVQQHSYHVAACTVKTSEVQRRKSLGSDFIRVGTRVN